MTAKEVRGRTRAKTKAANMIPPKRRHRVAAFGGQVHLHWFIATSPGLCPEHCFWVAPVAFLLRRIEMTKTASGLRVPALSKETI